MENTNLRRHCYAVGAAMGALYDYLSANNPDESTLNTSREEWIITGILHDMDYEIIKDDNPEINHTLKTLKWLEESEYEVSEYIINAIRAHAWRYVESAPEPQNNMEWAIYTCDELTGFIVAVALIRPDPPSHEAMEGQGKISKLNQVDVNSVLKKWNQKAFANGVHREQIEMCEQKLDIKLEDFIKIVLSSMQKIHTELGL